MILAVAVRALARWQDEWNIDLRAGTLHIWWTRFEDGHINVTTDVKLSSTLNMRPRQVAVV